MLAPDPDDPGGRAPPSPLSLLAVRAVESAAWTATIALSGLLAGPVLALAATLTHAHWLARAAATVAKTALAISVLAAALVLIAVAVVNLDDDNPDP